MNSQRSIVPLSIAILALAITACGGGGGGGGGPDTILDGTVTDAITTNNLDEQVQITLVPVVGGAPISFSAAADGTYSEKVDAGIYDLSAVRPDYELFMAGGVVVVDEVTTTFDIAMQPRTLVMGTVSDVTAGALDEYVTLKFTANAGGAETETETDVNGFYKVELAPGDYALMVGRPGYEYLTIASLAVPLGHTTEDYGLQPLPDGEYVLQGSQGCGECHETMFDNFMQSAHPFKINKIENDQVPTYPFSTIVGALGMISDDNGGTDNTLGTPLSYADVSYVIGGFGWKARFMDANGFIVTGSAVQYNLEATPPGMVSYHNDEVDKPFNCGNCHTTGWKHFDDSTGTNKNPNREENLPGIDGTWAHAGIQCESCHGGGAKHAQTQAKADITLLASARTTADFLAADMAYGKAVSCSECHTRDGEKDYPSYVSGYNNAGGPELEGGRILASGGLIRHHEQYDEILGVDPDNVTNGSTRNNIGSAMWDCLTCHDPHTTTKYQDDPLNTSPPGVKKANSDCMVCHSDNDPNLRSNSSSAMNALNCTDCHMPPLVKSARSIPAVGSGPVTGDIKSHIFKIDLSKPTQITGSFSYPWITQTFACDICHDGSGGTGKSFTLGSMTSFKFHDNK